MLRDARPDDEHVSPHGRVMEVLSEHNCQGWLEGYLLTGRHGLFATYEAFAMVSASMAIQHAKWLQHGRELEWRAPVASLNVLLTSTCWRNDNNGFSHQGPGLIDTMISMSGSVVRVYLPPDANCLLWTADHCLRSRDYVNLIVIDKQPELQYLDIEAAREHCARGAGEWAWAGNALGDEEPDVVLACIGDVPTQETIAAAALLREHVPGAALPRRQRRRPDGGDARRGASARDVARSLRGAVRRDDRTSSARFTATRARCTSCSTAVRTPSASTSTATASRARRRRRSTWSSSTR